MNRGTGHRFRLPRERGSAAALLAALLVAGCATRAPDPAPVPDRRPAQEREVVVREGPAPRHERDRAPPPEQIPYDVAQTPDAVPREEPRSRYGNPTSYAVFGKRYHVLPTADGYRERGGASWYGEKFHGRRTSSGEPYDMFAMTAAHKTLPLPSYARVTHLGNGRSIVVRVNDRGPFHDDRIIDLSYAAAARLDMVEAGSAPVEVVALSPRPDEQTAYLIVGDAGDIVESVALRERLLRLGVEGLHIQLRDDQRYELRLGPLADAQARQDMRDWLQARAFPVREPAH